jgi:hypothetical protein
VLCYSVQQNGYRFLWRKGNCLGATPSCTIHVVWATFKFLSSLSSGLAHLSDVVCSIESRWLIMIVGLLVIVSIHVVAHCDSIRPLSCICCELWWGSVRVWSLRVHFWQLSTNHIQDWAWFQRSRRRCNSEGARCLSWDMVRRMLRECCLPFTQSGCCWLRLLFLSLV